MPPFRLLTRLLKADDLRLLTRVWREWVSPHRGALLRAFALMALTAAATGLYPLLIDQSYAMFDAGGGPRVWLIPLAIVAATAVKAAAFYAQTTVTNTLAQRIVTDVRIRMFAHLQQADLAQMQETPAAALTARFLNDVDVVKAMLTRTLTGLVRDALTVAALVAAMVWLDWVMALMIFVVYPLAAQPIIAVGRRLRRLSGDAQNQTGRMLAVLGESLAGARMVKTYGLESYEEARAAAAFGDSRRLSVAATRQRARLDPLLEAIGGLAVAGVVGMAGWRIASGAGTVGEFSGFIGALLIAAQPLRAVGSINSVLQEGLAAVERCFALLDAAPQVVDAPDARPLLRGPGAIDFDNVRLRYPGAAADALTGLTLSVPPGKTTALVGPSGAGKSTLFNLILRLYDADAGAVRIDGQDVRGVARASLRAAIAVVSQDSVLFDDTVAANIGFGRPGATRADIVAAAQAAAADDFIRALPHGYDTRVGPDGGSLSGGQRQRLALARAFLKDAPILLLDEATSALDAESERLVQDALTRLCAGRTTLVIAHRLSTVRRADYIVALDGGQAAEAGDHDALLAQGGLYARLCAAQLADHPA